MPRRGENIRKRKDGRWEARYKKGVDEQGRTVYGSVYAKTYKEVKEKKREVLLPNPTKTELAGCVPLLREVLPLWFDDNRIRQKGATQYRYQCLVRAHILPDLGDKRLDQLTGPFINAYLAEKLIHGRLDGKGGLSASYVRSIMLVLQSILAFSASQSLCKPMEAKIHKPAVVSRELPILSRDHQKRLERFCLAEMDETRAGILISLYAGLRVGEICALRWEDIDFDKHILHVRHTVARIRLDSSSDAVSSQLVIDRPKTTSSLRDIPLASCLVPYLLALNQQSASPFVTCKGEEFISPRTYQYRYHSLLKQCGIPQINYHALRHTFATRCIEAGVDVKSLSEMLGHADASITLNTYVHSSMEQKRTQLEKLVQLGSIPEWGQNMVK